MKPMVLGHGPLQYLGLYFGGKTIQWSNLSWLNRTLKSYRAQSLVGNSELGSSSGRWISRLLSPCLLFEESLFHRLFSPIRFSGLKTFCSWNVLAAVAGFWPAFDPLSSNLWWAILPVSLRYRSRGGDLRMNFSEPLPLSCPALCSSGQVTLMSRCMFFFWNFKRGRRNEVMSTSTQFLLLFLSVVAVKFRAYWIAGHSWHWFECSCSLILR